MSRLTFAINLQFGKNDLSYQDVILQMPVNCPSPRPRNLHALACEATRQPVLRNGALLQIIPSNRGSHSEISGM